MEQYIQAFKDAANYNPTIKAWMEDVVALSKVYSSLKEFRRLEHAAGADLKVSTELIDKLDSELWELMMIPAEVARDLYETR